MANGKLLRSALFKDIWIEAAAGDALGAYHMMLNKPRRVCRSDAMVDAYLGPYALGARSIIAGPRSPTVQKQLNPKVKYRESFRPSARACYVKIFQIGSISMSIGPYVPLAADFAASKQIAMTEAQCSLFGLDKLNVPKPVIPAVTHVHYSARVQTVNAETNPRYYALVRRFKELTGCPVIVNTSFDMRGAPIVCTPKDAFNCLMGTEIDLLAIATTLSGETSRIRPWRKTKTQ